MWKPYMLAIVGQPSLHGSYACMVYGAQGALWRICRHTISPKMITVLTRYRPIVLELI